MAFGPFFTQPDPPQVGYANLATAVSEIWAPLNASGPDDAIYWTDTELFQWMDEEAKKLARARGIFVERDETLASVSGQGDYSLPPRHINTLQLDLSGRTLKPRNVQEVEALDSDWTNTVGTPKSFLLDRQGLEVLTLYPKPFDAPDTIGMVNSVSIADISADAAVIGICPCMRECFTFAALAGALSKETIASKNEVVPWLRSLVSLYEDAASGLWGI